MRDEPDLPIDMTPDAAGAGFPMDDGHMFKRLRPSFLVRDDRTRGTSGGPAGPAALIQHEVLARLETPEKFAVLASTMNAQDKLPRFRWQRLLPLPPGQRGAVARVQIQESAERPSVAIDSGCLRIGLGDVADVLRIGVPWGNATGKPTYVVGGGAKKQVLYLAPNESAYWQARAWLDPDGPRAAATNDRSVSPSSLARGLAMGIAPGCSSGSAVAAPPRVNAYLDDVACASSSVRSLLPSPRPGLGR